MEKVNINGLYLWQFESLSRETAVKHFVTDRSSNETPTIKGSPTSMKNSLGVPDEPLKTDTFSEENRKEFTLSLVSTPDREAVEHNRSQLAAAMGVGVNCLYFPSQVHKTRIVRVCSSTPKEELMETDALVTNEKGICIAVMSADCVPILLYDKKNGAVGAVHSGWRGTVARILEKTLQEMHARFGTKGPDLIACIGPSVCQESYEVGEEVVQEVNSAFGRESGLMIPQAQNKAKLDLWKANKIQLLDFGVAESNIEIADLCTVKNNDSFFSARKGDAGRFAAGIMLV